MLFDFQYYIITIEIYSKKRKIIVKPFPLINNII